MTQDASLSCSLPGAYHCLLPCINHLGVGPFVHAAEPYLPLWPKLPTSLYGAFRINSPSPHPHVDKWMTERGEWTRRAWVSAEQCIWKTNHCLTWTAWVVYPIHGLICTSPTPLVQVSRNRKWWTSHCLPCGTPLTAALSTKQRYKGIIADNICVTDGDQLLPVKETSTLATENNLWSNILAKWHLQEGRKCSEVNGMKGRGCRGGKAGGVIECCQRGLDRLAT